MQIAQGLRQCPLFSALPEDSLGILSQLAQKQAVKRGHLFFERGDPCEGFFILIEGSVKVYLLSASGREHVLNVARPGQSFAEAALFAGKDYPAFAEALEDSLVLFFPKQSFLDLLHERTEISFYMVAGLSQWLRRVVGLMEDTVLEDVDTRLARYLLQLAAAMPLENRSGGKVLLPMKKHVLASHLATTAPTLSRAIGRLEEEGLIQLEDREVVFRDLEGLQMKAIGGGG
jgi:CRP/FNR family transcriptional regulator